METGLSVLTAALHPMCLDDGSYINIPCYSNSDRVISTQCKALYFFIISFAA